MQKHLLHILRNKLKVVQQQVDDGTNVNCDLHRLVMMQLEGPLWTRRQHDVEQLSDELAQLLLICPWSNGDPFSPFDKDSPNLWDAESVGGQQRRNAVNWLGYYLDCVLTSI